MIQRPKALVARLQRAKVGVIYRACKVPLSISEAFQKSLRFFEKMRAFEGKHCKNVGLVINVHSYGQRESIALKFLPSYVLSLLRAKDKTGGRHE